MADIVDVDAQIGVVFPETATIRNVIAAVSIEAGQGLYLTSSGTYGLADANAANRQQIRGVALEAAGAGQAISMLEEGLVYGYTITGMAYDDLVYVSDTAGALSTTVGTLTVQCGRIVPLADADKTKVLYFSVDRLREWA